MRSFWPRLWLQVTFAGVLAGGLAAQSTTDLVRGRVTSTDSVPLAGARITVLSLVTRMSRTAYTNSDGRYTVVFPSGGGNYLASYNMIGYHPVVRQVRRFNDEDLLVQDVMMRPSPIVLEDFVITARSLPPRGDFRPDSTGVWYDINGVGVPLTDLGNLAVMASYLPGVTLQTDADGNPTGISVFGLSADQNLITVDGVEQDMKNLPVEGMPAARLTTTTSDPARGGFSAANIQVQSRPGSWAVSRSLGLIVDAPGLQFGDGLTSQLGKRYTDIKLSGETSGPIIEEKLTFRGSFQMGQKTSPRKTILNTGTGALEVLGVSPDSLARLLLAMDQLGIPASRSGIPSSQLSRNGSLMLRSDYSPEGTTHSVNGTFNASWSNEASWSSLPLTVPTRGGESTSLNWSAQLNHSYYFPLSILSETKVALSRSKSGSEAYLGLPDIGVRVRSAAADGRTTTSNFRLGGNSAMPTSNDALKWQFTNTLSWASEGNAHRLQLATDLKFDASTQAKSSNSLGTFSFNSLEDFINGVPSDFRRQLTSVEKQADLFTAAFSLGDQWRASKTLLFQYGVRLELDHYSTRPEFNQAVLDAFGVRNDFAPNRAHFIPRFGFTWTYGTAPTIAAFDGAKRGPKATLKGTIGEYRNTPRNSLLQSAIGSTGLPDGIQLLSCKGVAAPVPDWASYASDPSTVPDTCADGTESSVFTDDRPDVLYFARDYSPERSWRADIGWSGTALRRYKLSIGGLVSWNIAQTSDVDVNFDNTVHFRLPAELNRPVFVPVEGISSRGSASTTQNRVAGDFSRVNERRSDLQSLATQFDLSLSPVVVAPSAVRWSVSYVHARDSDFQRGFGGTTRANPLWRSWERATSPMHQIGASASYSILGVKLGLSGRLTSGVHYTPMVRGDINGDGQSNDRAFVFSPDAVSDSTLAAGMQSLLERAPSGARRCLREQLGRIAGANSCTGPWSTAINFTLSLEAMKLAIPGRATVTFSFGDPLTGLDLLLNGHAGKRSWGQSNSSPDATLLYVRGFDPDTRQFRYEVNEDFGDTRKSKAKRGRPFSVTLRFQSDVSPPAAKQVLRHQIDGWQSGRTRRPSESSLQQQYVQRYKVMFESIIRQRDTLGLSAAQADSIDRMNGVYFQKLDSLWQPVLQYMATEEGRYDVADVYSRIQQLERTSLDILGVHAQAVRAVLTHEQFNLLPPSYGPYFDIKQLRKMRP